MNATVIVNNMISSLICNYINSLVRGTSLCAMTCINYYALQIWKNLFLLYQAITYQLKEHNFF
jgi:hypothetical protein